MVLITEDLVRKRAEHNNYELSSLEEVSLHQQDIEVIENIDKWCRELKILYLQSNLIGKIQNVAKLKKLEYLNLALNNITKIENLSKCESLKKLDLTVNFIAELTSVESLRSNCFFSELYLTGNPCTQYDGYREYVIATLPQLKQLDGKEIEKSERIIAVQQYTAIRDGILQQQAHYEKHQNKKKGKNDSWYTDIGGESKEQTSNSKIQELSEDEKEKLYWSEPTSYTPESRIEMHNHIKEQSEKKNEKQRGVDDPNTPKRQVRFFKENGEPLNVNTAKINFVLNDEEKEGRYALSVECYKHLETSLMDVDVQPHYVRVVIKDKVLQIALIEEVNPDKSSAQRSETTGHLLIRMPKAAEVIGRKKSKVPMELKPTHSKKQNSHESNLDVKGKEEDSKASVSLSDLASIVKKNPKCTPKEKIAKESKFEAMDDDFIDDPDVPPLI